MTQAPIISVVVPTYQRCARLHAVLESLASQDFDEPYEVIVVSDGSTDGTDEYLAGGDVPLAIHAIFQPNGGPAVARNAGVDKARADLVLFLDDDVVAEPSLLRRHVEAHRRLGDAAVVIGPMLDPEGYEMSPWVAWEQEMLAKQYRALQGGEFAATARQFYTGNASLGRRHLVAAGGFDSRFRRAEDVELAVRLADSGLEFHFENEAVGRHYAQRSYGSWKEAAYLYGRNDVVFARDLEWNWMYHFLVEAYMRQHWSVRRLVSTCAGRPRIEGGVQRGLAWFVRAATIPGLRSVRGRALSGVYAMEYHRGVADELGLAAYRELFGREFE